MDSYELKRLNKHTVLRKDISIKKKLEHLIIHNSTTIDFRITESDGIRSRAPMFFLSIWF
jgi:hypothetical protein